MQKPPGNGNSNGNRPPGRKTPPPMPPLSEPRLGQHTIVPQTIVKSLHNTYQVIEQIGEGGMGTVHSALNIRTDETVAIKFIQKKSTRSLNESDRKTAMQRFEREANVAVMVQHPNVIETIDFGFHEGDPFIVMEYFPGSSLQGIIMDAVDGENRSAVTWSWFGPVMMRVCEGLNAAHVQHIMHRDIKPGNIMVQMADGEGENWEVLRAVIGVKILDFGLAKYIKEQGKGDDLTRKGVLAGTWDYMAPEQIENARQGIDIDHRVDIYSLGAVAYRVMTGEPPFSPEVEGLFERLNRMPTRPTLVRPGIPLEAETVILKAMATKREGRYHTAIDMRSAIAASLGYETPQPERGSVTLAEIAPMLQKKKSRGWVGKTIATVLVTAAVGLGVYFGYEHWPEIKQKAMRLIKGDTTADDSPSKEITEKKGYVMKVESEPSGLTVFRVDRVKREVRRKLKEVDNEVFLGKTPLSTVLEPGEHKLRVRKKWNRPIDFKVDGNKPTCTVSFYRRRVNCR